MKLHRLLMLCALVALALCFCVPRAHATTTGNLVVGGDAEEGTWTVDGLTEPYGWYPIYIPGEGYEPPALGLGTYTSSFYGAGPTQAVGDHYFCFGAGDAAYQWPDLSSYPEGSAVCTFSAWIGYSAIHHGCPSAGLVFYDSSGFVMAQVGLNGSLLVSTYGSSVATTPGLWYLSGTVTIPVGYSKAEVDVNTTPYQVVDDVALTVTY